VGRAAVDVIIVLYCTGN